MSHKPTVVGLGEILWDVFPEGPRFGGAPANVACHAAQLGASASMVSAVGPDELGDKAIRALKEKGVETSRVAESNFPTGIVNVQLDKAGKASYQFAADTAWDHLEWSTGLETLAGKTQAVCFGTLGQRSEMSRQTIHEFVKSVPADSLRVFDINLRPPFYTDAIIRDSLAIANILKLNDDELPILARLSGLRGSDVEILKALSEQQKLRLVALTRGDQGAVLCRGEEISDCPGFPTTVADTVGAGDAFTAALVIGLLNNRPLDAINEAACKIAAFVCSQPGATPELPSNLKTF
jgi:fructokinase